MRKLLMIITLGLLLVNQPVFGQTDYFAEFNDFIGKTTTDYKVIETDDTPLRQLSPSKDYTLTKIKALQPHSNKNSYGQTVYQRIKIEQYIYENSDSCKSAIDKLLSCFPNDCCKIEYGVDGGCKITPTIFIFSKSRIIRAVTSCEHVNESWETFMKDLVEYIADDDDDIIVTKCGPVKWTTKERIENAP